MTQDEVNRLVIKELSKYRHDSITTYDGNFIVRFFSSNVDVHYAFVRYGSSNRIGFHTQYDSVLEGVIKAGDRERLKRSMFMLFGVNLSQIV
jgi:hypothetical protein